MDLFSWAKLWLWKATPWIGWLWCCRLDSDMLEPVQSTRISHTSFVGEQIRPFTVHALSGISWKASP